MAVVRSVVLLLAFILEPLATYAANRGATCPARIRTLAYVLTECRETVGGLFLRQALQIRHRERAPVTVMEAEAEFPSVAQPDLAGLVELAREICREGGQLRLGRDLMPIGVFQRIGALPDASGVVFEVTNVVNPLTRRVPLQQAGIFFVRSNGSGLRALGPASGDAGYDLADPDNFIRSFFFAVSPDSRMIAFTDMVGSGDEDPLQIVALDVRTAKRTPVTHLPKTLLGAGKRLIDVVIFGGRRTIVFTTRANPIVRGKELNPTNDLVTLRVRTDGRGLRLGHAVLDPSTMKGTRPGAGGLEIAGGARGVADLFFPDRTPVNPNRKAGYETVAEVFRFQRHPLNFLQLTNFSRVDTFSQFVDVNERRAFFLASDDPLGENTTETCQLFSIDLLGASASLRQVTHFSESDHSLNGCLFGLPPGCTVHFSEQDPATRTVAFTSSCDPFGANSNGDQLFAIRPDGSGLRQLTQARGLSIDSEGRVSVELPGTFAYPHLGPD